MEHGLPVRKGDVSVDRQRGLRDRLVLAIERSGLTKAEIAGTVGVRPATLSAWIAEGDGFSVPAGEQLLQLPEVLGVSGHWLLTGEGPMEPETGLEGLRLQVIGRVADSTLDDEAVKAIANLGQEEPAAVAQALLHALGVLGELSGPKKKAGP